MYLPVWYTILSHHTGGSGSMAAKRHALIHIHELMTVNGRHMRIGA